MRFLLNPRSLQPQSLRSLFAALAIATGFALVSMAQANPEFVSLQAHNLQVAQGNDRILRLDATPLRIALGNPAIASVHPLQGSGGQELLITGKTPGSTNLMVWTVGHHYPQVWNLTVGVPVPHAPLAAPAPGMPRVRSQGPAVTLSGAVASQMQLENAITAAQAFAGKDGKVIDNAVIPVDDEVQIGVKVVEFSKTQLQNIGINFFAKTSNFTLGTFAPVTVSPSTATSLFSSAALGAEGSPIGQAFSVLGGGSGGNILGYLNMLQNNNILRVLAEPTLVAMNGHKASFLAGGEIPIPVPQSSGAGTPTVTIQYKKYGVALDVTPTILSANRIALHIAPSVSSLDYTNALTLNGYSVPALQVRQANTTVTLGNGESLVIGGLVDRQMQQNLSKVPLLGDLPIIGAFFRSIQYSKSDMELAIIVTPRLVRPIAAGAQLPPLPGSEYANSHFNIGKALFLPGSDYDHSQGPGYSQ